jgi:hypothetical protein
VLEQFAPSSVFRWLQVRILTRKHNVEKKSYLGLFSVTPYWSRTLKQVTFVSSRIFHIHETSSNELRVERISDGTKKRSTEAKGEEQ